MCYNTNNYSMNEGIHMSYSLKAKSNRDIFSSGMKDGLPIGLGYFAVAFSLGIAAKNAGLNFFQSALVSLLCNASAGEYAGFTTIAAGAAYIEIAIITLIANARYLLMSCALSQRIDPHMPFFHRFFIAFDITDELFAINIARPGYVNPLYTYGAMLIAMPMWSAGTAFGNLAGNLLPLRLVSAFSVALYGMFLAVIIPPTRKSKILTGIILVCFAASWAAANLPYVSTLSDGTRTIILTILLASAAAILFPIDTEKEAEQK